MGSDKHLKITVLNFIMSVKKEYLGKIAENVLRVFDSEKIESLSDLDRIMNKRFPIESVKEQILIELRPSSLGTTVRTVAYMIEGGGMPLEIKINEELGYSKMMVKGTFVLPDYRPVANDIFGNTFQNKKLDSIDISQIRYELKKLA